MFYIIRHWRVQLYPFVNELSVSYLVYCGFYLACYVTDNLFAEARTCTDVDSLVVTMFSSHCKMLILSKGCPKNLHTKYETQKVRIQGAIITRNILIQVHLQRERWIICVERNRSHVVFCFVIKDRIFLKMLNFFHAWRILGHPAFL